MKNLTLLAVLVFSLSSLFAGEGNELKKSESLANSSIEGKIIDKATNEALVGVTLMLKGSDKKYYTDLDGNFAIEGLVPGQYNINVMYVSYQGVSLEEISTANNNLKLKVEIESISK